ncbi:MAG: Gst12 glutathione-S-transferase [Frankiales bacterium]|nr:Gst12 glutathione-S-transferase [Frankiales bacterium]
MTSAVKPVLYCASLDADSFAVRLLLGALEIPHEQGAVDVHPGTDEPSRRILRSAPAPAAELPILDLAGSLTAGLAPVLRLIARELDPAEQLASDTPDIERWLDFATGPLRTATRARLSSLLGGSGDLSSADFSAARLTVLTVEDALAERRLLGQRWIASALPPGQIGPARPSIADFALYPAIALSRDFGLEHQEFPAIRRWLHDVRMLAPGVSMPGVLDPI